MTPPASLLPGALALAVVATFSAPAPAAPLAKGGKPVDFTRDVRPILSGKCYRCHGPDDKARKAKPRLDTREGATKLLRSGSAAVVPGDPDKSELLARVGSSDET